jgi:hypothetical protein
MREKISEIVCPYDYNSMRIYNVVDYNSEWGSNVVDYNSMRL